MNKNNTLICLGKVESRKRQFELYECCRSANIDIHFYGAIQDPRVKKLIVTDSLAQQFFRGPISRDDLKRILGNYKALIHVSDAEADALVLYEAQLAGLPLLLTNNSIGSQNRSLPWVNVLSENFSAVEIQEKLDSLTFSRDEIIEYANNSYHWSKRLTPIIDILKATGSK